MTELPARVVVNPDGHPSTPHLHKNLGDVNCTTLLRAGPIYLEPTKRKGAEWTSNLGREFRYG